MDSGENGMVLIKKEIEYNVVDDGFDRTEVKFEPCQIEKYDRSGSESDPTDQRNEYCKYENQNEEKYVAIKREIENFDYTDLSTQCNTEPIKSEYDIYYGDVKTEFVEKKPEICENKNFQGKVCSEAFDHSVELKAHEKTHTVKKPFCCKICSKEFAHASKFKRHERIHTGEKQFSCNSCSNAFANSWDLKVHERIHSGERPFRCNICRKAFTQSNSLKIHERIHTGEKPFWCKICSKTFTHSNSLIYHERVHKGDKPFHCRICSKSFYQSCSLKRHERIHPGRKPKETSQTDGC